MHILFINKDNYISTYQPGRRVELPRALAGLGHRVGLISTCYTWHKPEIRAGHYDYVFLLSIGHVPFLMSAVHFIKMCFALARSLYFSKDRPEVVITDYASVWSCIPFVLLGRLSKVRPKFILDIRSLPIIDYANRKKIKDIEYRSAIWAAKNIYAGITVITPALRNDIARQYNIDPEAIGLWSSGAALDIFDPARAVIPAEMERFKDKFVIMHHGVLTLTRGLGQTVEAMRLLADKYPDIILFFLGDGSGKEALEKLVEVNHLGERVFFHPSVPYAEVPNYLASADAGIIPLPDIDWWRVSSPQKLLECMAMEKPVVVSDIIAHRAVVGDSACGFYISAVEPEQVAEAIGRLYEKKDRLKELGKQGRQIIAEGFTWDAQARNLDAYIKRVYAK